MKGKSPPGESADAIFDAIGEYYDPPPAYALAELGLFSLTLKDAAKLVAVDMWFSSEIEARDFERPDDDGVDADDPRLIAGLSTAIQGLVTRLSAAVSSGSLKTTWVARNLNEHISPESTYVEVHALREWLESRGYFPGDVFADRESSDQLIAERLSEEIPLLRERMKRDPFLRHDIDARGELQHAYTENARLRDELNRLRSGAPSTVDRTLTTRARRTLLVMIGAICREAEIDWNARGAATRIAEMTDRLGAPVSEETIKKVLAEIDEAKDSRAR